MSEAITVIENICSKPMMHMDTCLKIFEHTLDKFNECCTFPYCDKLLQLIYGTAMLSHTKISDFHKALLTCIIWNRVFNRHRKRKYFESTPEATQTKAPTVCLSSINIQYSGVSECMGFHLSKVLFSSSNF
jgi:hypothetical protein